MIQRSKVVRYQFSMASRKPKQPVKQVNPLVAEFLQSCKTQQFNDQDLITYITNQLEKSETVFRLCQVSILPSYGKSLLRLFQKYQRLSQIIFYACPIQDPTFTKQLAAEFAKNSANVLQLDYCPIDRDTITPLLSAQTLDVLSLRGNQCLTPYNFVTHAPGPFTSSLNSFFTALATSTLKVLNLFGCHIGDTGTIALANCLVLNTSLRCLCLSNNRIGDPGAFALADALSSRLLTEQEALIVDRFVNEESKQKISDEGGGLLKKGKKGSKGASKKAPAKPTSKKGQQVKQPQERPMNFDPEAPVNVVILSKWQSCITDDVGNKILPGNSTITSLLLKDNDITLSGATALKNMLQTNTKIVCFDIDGNPEIEPEMIQAMKRECPPETS